MNTILRISADCLPTVSVLPSTVLPVPWTPLVQSVRTRKRRINIQKPEQPHYAKLKLFYVTKPIFPEPVKNLPLYQMCQRPNEVKKTKQTEDSQYRRLIAKGIRNWLEQSRAIALYHRNPMPEDEVFKARVVLHKYNMVLKAYGRDLIKMAVVGSKFESILHLFQCPHTIFVFSQSPQIGAALHKLRKFPQLVLLAGIVDGKFLSKDEFVEYNKIPNLEAVQAQLSTLLTMHVSKTSVTLSHHQHDLVRSLQHHIEQQKEKE